MGFTLLSTERGISYVTIGIYIIIYIPSSSLVYILKISRHKIYFVIA
jgi:hypothetical protein